MRKSCHGGPVDSLPKVQGETMRYIFPLLALMATLAQAKAHEPNLDAQIRNYILENPEVILEALEVLSAREQRMELREKLSSHRQIFEDPPILGIGRVDAPVRVVEFFDYRCAPCKAMHPPLKKLVAANPDVRIEMRQLPILSPGSERGARFALGVQAVLGNAAYATAHQALWTLRGPLNEASFRRLAEAEGWDYAAIAVAMESDAVSERIGYNRDFAVDMAILGTPAFVTPESVTFGTAEIEDLKALWLSQ